MNRHLFVVLFLTAASSVSFALKTYYVTFDHPEGWHCERAQGVWICQSQNEAERKDSVVLSIATVATDFDKLDNFYDYLNKPKTITDEDGSALESKITFTRRRNINGFDWIDSLQFNSELAGFWTRYLATVHTTPEHKIAILITYVVADEKYKAMAPVFERMISSLKPNADFDKNFASLQGSDPLLGSEILGPKGNTKDLLAERLNTKRKPKEEPKSDGSLMILLGVLLVAGAGFVVFKKKNKKAPPPPSEPQA